jgi:hypothetical protein
LQVILSQAFWDFQLTGPFGFSAWLVHVPPFSNSSPTKSRSQ